jgi:alkanesulfonate monooxygenase SsuD/methylene tetrahydromethanopterin reductase-like flavin-dependent oxidoreductase (luciferase family)
MGADQGTIERPFDTRFHLATGRRYAGAYPGALPLVGTPDDVAAELVMMCEQGLAGTSIAFLDYLKEIPFFVQEVLPRLERAGVRQPAQPLIG